MLLAIDTATRYASLALYNGERVLSEETWRTANYHTVELMPAVVRMLERQGVSAEALSAVGVSLGPGSFTGLRVGLAVAIIVDATIIRSILLPASMKLLGDLNWYLPRWLEWIPRIQMAE